MWAAGERCAVITRELAVSKNAVVGKVGRLGLPRRPNPTKRDPHRNDEIFRLHALGWSNAEIGRRCGLPMYIVYGRIRWARDHDQLPETVPVAPRTTLPPLPSLAECEL
jgi:hypothetical protein